MLAAAGEPASAAATGESASPGATRKVSPTTARKPASPTTARKPASAATAARKMPATAAPTPIAPTASVPAAALRERNAGSNKHQHASQQSSKREFERKQFLSHEGPHFTTQYAHGLPFTTY